MSKQTSFNLGGKDRIVEWGKYYFSKYYGEITGTDPLNSSDFLLKPEKQFDFVVAIVYAGIKTYNKSNKIVEEITKEEVEDWVGDLTDDEAAAIINAFIEYRKPKETGEASAPESGA